MYSHLFSLRVAVYLNASYTLELLGELLKYISIQILSLEILI